MITVEEKFSACIVLGDLLLPNSWRVNIELMPMEKEFSQDNYGKALDRIKFYFTDVIDKNLFLCPDSLKYFSTPTGIQSTVQLFPEPPTDHLLAICLFTKITSIMNPVFAVNRLTVSGLLINEGISHSHDIEIGDLDSLRSVTEAASEEYANYWYRPDITAFELTKDGMQLVTESWADYGLNYGS